MAAVAAPCLLGGGVARAAVNSRRLSSPPSRGCCCSSSAPARRCPLRLRAAADSSSDEFVSSTDTSAELDFPDAPAATSTSLVARSSEIVSRDGASGLAQVDHYQILGVPYGAPMEQIAEAFRKRRDEVTGQQTEGNEEASKEMTRALKESFDILMSDEDRRLYDWALTRYQTINKDTYIWPYETDITQLYNSDVEPRVMRSFDDEGTYRVGYFFLAFFILSVILSVTMRTWIEVPHYALSSPFSS